MDAILFMSVSIRARVLQSVKFGTLVVLLDAFARLLYSF